MRAARLAAAVAFVLLASGAAAAQDRPTFRASTDLVLLTVTADDGRGRATTGLAEQDFQVLEDGRPQTISFFARDPQPISLSILLDTSSSMDRKLATAQVGAAGFVRRLGPEDEAQIVSFDSDIQILQPFTNEISALENAVRRTRAVGSTALYSAIAVAFSELSRVARRRSADELHRQAIVILSDGEDTASRLDYEELITQAKRSDVVIYSIAMRDRRPTPNRGFNSSTYVLRTLSQSTGGQVFFVEDVEQLPGIYNQIADELANQYTIGFVSNNTNRDGAWRQISVRVARPGVVARTRAGYYGPRRVP